MEKKYSENFYSKINFIYAKNKKTPLFVSKAAYEIKDKNISSAIDILINGITAYPNFAAAYLLLGKAFALKEDYNLAIENIKKGSDLINSKKTYDFYLNEIENIKKRKSFGEAEVVDDEEEKLEEEDETRRPLPADESIEDLIKEISSNKDSEIKKHKPSVKKAGNNLIISETLAKIYSAQGGFQEAIDVYKKLIEKHPDKEEYYTKKIDELKTKLE